MEEFYAEIPKALIKKIYAKYQGFTIQFLFLLSSMFYVQYESYSTIYFQVFEL